jgi:hypothetical protein
MDARPEHTCIRGGKNSRIAAASGQPGNANIFESYCGKGQAMLSSGIFFEAFGDVFSMVLREYGRRIRQAQKNTT